MRVYVIMQLVTVWAAILNGMLCGKLSFSLFWEGDLLQKLINFSCIEKYFHILAHVICICYNVSLMYVAIV